ncbi:MAG: hypothetical protein OEY51_05620 [Cyclobacteriaceae bacterium]|nr:hypothetical protein [Cyclobacteriaceae bacterium]
MRRFKTFSYTVLLLLLMATCKEPQVTEYDLNLTDQQKATVTMRGVWGQPSDIVLPFGTTETVLDNILLTFTISDDYGPQAFSSIGADDVFLADGNATWNWKDATTLEDIELNGVSPISQIKVMKGGGKLRLTFYYDGVSGGRTEGIGEYGVTLVKISPK